MPTVSLSTFATGARQLVVQEALEIDVVHGGVVGGLEVDPEHDRDVGVGRRRGDDRPSWRPALQVDRGVGAVGEEPGGLDHHVHAELLPGQLRGVALGEHLQLGPSTSIAPSSARTSPG